MGAGVLAKVGEVSRRWAAREIGRGSGWVGPPRIPCGRGRTVAGLCVMFRGEATAAANPPAAFRRPQAPGRVPMTSTQDADLKPTLAALVDKHAERLNE